jgi:hypothetical protein
LIYKINFEKKGFSRKKAFAKAKIYGRIILVGKTFEIL